MSLNIPKNKHIVFFDGVCNLCNSSIQYIIKNDIENQFLFAPLQGKTAKTISNYFNVNFQEVDSIFLFTPEEEVLTKAKAALTIASKLRMPIRLLSVFLIVPSFVSDKVYDFIAKNRYKWFGAKEACYIPTPELNAKFLK